MKHEELENIRVLLQNREQLRRHWSGLIINLTGFLVVGIAAVLSFITTFVFNNLDDFSKVYSAFIVTVGLCSTAVGFIRWYIRSVDNQIVRIYPSILRYEQILGVSDDEGILEYLLTHWGKDQKIKQESLTSFLTLNDDERVSVLKILINKGRMGGRGHEIIDLIFLIVIALLAVLLGCLFLKSDIDFPILLVITGFLLIIAGWILVYRAYSKYQRKPKKEDIECAINEVITSRIVIKA